MIVGTMPGVEEERQQSAFCGKNGTAVRNILASLGVDDPHFTNVIKYRCKDIFGRDRKPKSQDVFASKSIMIKELQMVKPKVIISMGQVPLNFFADDRLMITTCHGLSMNITKYGMSYLLFPVYDIGYVNRKGGIFSRVGEEWLWDLENFAGEFLPAN